MKTEFILNTDNLFLIGNNINKFFRDGGNYIIIKNYNIQSDDEIMVTYNTLNNIIGRNVPIDLEKDTYNPTQRFWANVKYDYDSDEKQFWRSSNHQDLHTDNTFANDKLYANLTELVCIKPVEYSGHTTIISNEKIINLIKFIDSKTNKNLFEKLLNKELYFSCSEKEQVKKKVLTYNYEKDKYIFNFNYYPAIRAKNTIEDKLLIEDFHQFLEEKIMNSNGLMDEIILNRGDAIIFNDELVLHGRRSFIGTRFYKKTGINIDNYNLVDYTKFIFENKINS